MSAHIQWEDIYLCFNQIRFVLILLLKHLRQINKNAARFHSGVQMMMLLLRVVDPTTCPGLTVHYSRDFRKLLQVLGSDCTLLIPPLGTCFNHLFVSHSFWVQRNQMPAIYKGHYDVSEHPEMFFLEVHCAFAQINLSHSSIAHLNSSN